MKYDFITDDKSVKIKLSAEEQAMILDLHDNGVKVLNRDNIHILYGIISELKNQIHK